MFSLAIINAVSALRASWKAPIPAAPYLGRTVVPLALQSEVLRDVDQMKETSAASALFEIPVRKPEASPGKEDGTFSLGWKGMRERLGSRLFSLSSERWSQFFSECDGNDDGSIDRRELLVLFNRMGIAIDPEEVGLLFVQYDSDESGTLNLIEFKTMVRDLSSSALIPYALVWWKSTTTVFGAVRQWRQERKSLRLWREVFDELDLTKDGYLERNEIKTAFAKAGISVSDEDIERQLTKYDINNDGKFDFTEFSRMSTENLSRAVLFERARNKAKDRSMKFMEAQARAEYANEHRDVPYRMDTTYEARQLIEARIDEATFTEALDVLKVQDDFFCRFKLKYGAQIELNDYLTAERVLLFDALKAGDIDGIRALTNINWDFVYPPAHLDASGERALEAWCRSPLSLLVRPDEGNFPCFCRGMSNEERLGLVEDVLASGCADPNFPPIYWGGPAAHACFEGDVAALDILRKDGCNLKQKFEWLKQEEPTFSLAHAAAFNGNVEVLKYLRRFLPPSFFQTVDSTGSNPLHTLLESSRDLETARFLLSVGVDGFALNNLGRSPLSMAVEALPSLALELLQDKARFEYRWWGNDLYWYSFNGIVLPVDTADHDGSSPVTPLFFRDQDGKPARLEDLIIRHERKALLDTPVMRDLIEGKWASYAGPAYNRRIVTFVLMAVSSFVLAVSTAGDAIFYIAAGSTFVNWAFFFQGETERVLNKLREDTPPPVGENTKKVLFSIDALNVYNVAMTPLLATYVLASDAGLISLSPELDAIAAVLSGALQVTLTLYLLNLVTLFESIGPLLITTVQMVQDALRFLAVIAFVLLGYANGFYSLIHFGIGDENLPEETKGDYSYSAIVSNLGIWLSGQPDLSFIAPLSPNVQIGAYGLFWTFIGISSFVLLNLLIAIFNTTYEKVTANSFAEWLFIRLSTCREFEADMNLESIQSYLKQLRARDNQRAVRNS